MKKSNDQQLYFPWWSKKTPLKRTKEKIKSMTDVSELEIKKATEVTRIVAVKTKKQ